jgi:hypothetical protein
VFLGIHCQQIVASLTELALGLIEHEPILHIAVIAEILQIDLLLLHDAQNLLRTCPVQIKLNVTVLVERYHLEGLIRKVLEGIQSYAVLWYVAITQNTAFQFDDMVLSLRERGSESVCTVLSSANSDILSLGGL